MGGTHTWRDYNEDGVMDLGGNMYGTLTELEDPDVPRSPTPELGANSLKARGNRYANNIVQTHGG